MSGNTLFTDLYKGQWAMNVEAYKYFLPIFKSIVEGKKIELEVKAKNFIEYYDDAFDYVNRNEQGYLEIPEGTTAVINMIGPISTYGNYWFYGADEIVAQLEKLNKNPNIKAILVFIDGPGGAVSAVSPFMSFGNTRDKKKPLGIVYEQMNSAHLYAAYGMQPDFVWALNNITANAGSLGVMLSYLDDQKWMEMMGLKTVAVYPDESPDKNLPARLALEGKFDLIKEEMLSPLAKRFQADMIRLNPNLKSKEPGVTTGKVFYADDAIRVGFAQRIGTVKEALEQLSILGELNHYKN